MGIFLALHGVVGVHCAASMSVTHDEFWHLPLGLLSWKTGRFDFDRLNPPLVRMWAALPLVFTEANVGRIENFSDPRLHGDEFLKVNSARHQAYFVAGRTMIVLLSVVTGLVLAHWAWEFFGPHAAWLACLLWCACPTILGNASLVTTDLGAASFFVFTAYAVWKFAQRPSWRRSLSFGCLLGLAQLVKYTSLVLLPLSVVWWCLLRVRNLERDASVSKAKTTARWFAALLLSGVILNAGYLFQGTGSDLRNFEFQSQALRHIQLSLSWLPVLPVPLPEDYLLGLDRQRAVMESPHAVYLDGEMRVEGFRHYYLAALWYKLPHQFQLLVLAATLLVVGSKLGPHRDRQSFVGHVSNVPVSVEKPSTLETCSTFSARPHPWRMAVFLWLPVVTVVGLASASSMQIGVRYVLPAVPFLMLFASQTGQLVERLRGRARRIAPALAIVLVSCSVRYHPHHFAFFNELAGGPENGWQHLIDSNLDWGQDLRRLKQYLDANHLREIGLAYYGTFPPAALGIRYHLPPSWEPRPGWYAASVNYMMGRPHSVRLSDGSTRDVNVDEFGYFRDMTPVAHVGYSIRVYRLRETDVAQWRSVVSQSPND